MEFNRYIINERSGACLDWLMGDNDFESTYKKLNLQANVNKNTPPAFLCHTSLRAGSQ